MGVLHISRPCYFSHPAPPLLLLPSPVRKRRRHNETNIRWNTLRAQQIYRLLWVVTEVCHNLHFREVAENVRLTVRYVTVAIAILMACLLGCTFTIPTAHPFYPGQNELPRIAQGQFFYAGVRNRAALQCGSTRPPPPCG